MQSAPILLRIKSATSSKLLNFVADPTSTLKQIRQLVQNLNEIQLDQYVFLMKDKSPISVQAEGHVRISMITDESGLFYIEENLKSKKMIPSIEQKQEKKQQKSMISSKELNVVNSNIQDQIKHIQIIEKFDEFEQKIKALKLRIEQFNKTFAAKINALPKVDARYQGEISQFGVYEGIGRYLYDNGQIFIGTFKNGERSGIGCYTFKNGDRYEGEYKNNVASGLGIEIFATGSKMSAEYKKNSSNGLGIYYFADGSKLLGNFIDNHFDGKGVRVYPDGTWKNEQYNMGKLVNN